MTSIFVRGSLAVCAILLLNNESHARADELEKGAPAPHALVWTRHRTVDFAVGGPLGIGAVELEYAPIPQIGLGVGAGLDDDGVQGGVTLRVRGILGAWALGLGGGFSIGPQEVNDPPWPSFLHDGATYQTNWTWRLFGNFELAAEARSLTGVYTRLAVGASVPTGAEGGRRCSDNGYYGDSEAYSYAKCPDLDFFAYATIAIGFAF